MIVVINFELLIKLVDPDIIVIIVSNFLTIACIVCLRAQRLTLKPWIHGETDNVPNKYSINIDRKNVKSWIEVYLSFESGLLKPSYILNIKTVSCWSEIFVRR